MKQEQIISIVGPNIYTNGGRRIAIGNAGHKVGNWVWADSGYVFGHHSVVNSMQYIPEDANTIINATSEVIRIVKIAGEFMAWEDVEPVYSNASSYLCYNQSAICIMTRNSASMSWLKEYLNGEVETGSFSFIGTDKILSNAYLDKENKLGGTFLNSEGVYGFIDNEVSLLSAGFPSALPATPSYADDTYDYVYYASDDDRFYDGFLGNKILFSTEGVSKWPINDEYPVEESYTKFITMDGNKACLWHDGATVPYGFTVSVHADYYVEWLNDGSGSYLSATSIRFKSNDGTVDTDITQYISGRYFDLLSIMPILVITKKYMLLSFGDYLVLFDRAGQVIASQTYGTARTLDMPFVTKKVAERLIALLR